MPSMAIYWWSISVEKLGPWSSHHIMYFIILNAITLLNYRLFFHDDTLLYYLHLYAWYGDKIVILMKLWLGEVLHRNWPSQHLTSPSHNFVDTMLITLILSFYDRVRFYIVSCQKYCVPNRCGRTPFPLPTKVIPSWLTCEKRHSECETVVVVWLSSGLLLTYSRMYIALTCTLSYDVLLIDGINH